MITITPLADGTFKVEGVVRRDQFGPLKPGKPFMIGDKLVTPPEQRTYFVLQTGKTNSSLRGVNWENGQIANISFQCRIKANNFRVPPTEQELNAQKANRALGQAKSALATVARLTGKSAEDLALELASDGTIETAAEGEETGDNSAE